MRRFVPAKRNDMHEEGAMKYGGPVITESLDSEDCLGHLVMIRREEWHPENIAGYQPPVWNVVIFENDDDNIEAVLQALSRCIKERWFVDISAESKKYIVFKNKIFGYDRSSMTVKAEAIAYGRSVGVPEQQLNWPDFGDTMGQML
jgi:hypothetical protein